MFFAPFKHTSSEQHCSLGKFYFEETHIQRLIIPAVHGLSDPIQKARHISFNRPARCCSPKVLLRRFLITANAFCPRRAPNRSARRLKTPPANKFDAFTTLITYTLMASQRTHVTPPSSWSYILLLLMF